MRTVRTMLPFSLVLRTIFLLETSALSNAGTSLRGVDDTSALTWSKLNQGSALVIAAYCASCLGQAAVQCTARELWDALAQAPQNVVEWE